MRDRKTAREGEIPRAIKRRSQSDLRRDQGTESQKEKEKRENQKVGI